MKAKRSRLLSAFTFLLCSCCFLVTGAFAQRSGTLPGLLADAQDAIDSGRLEEARSTLVEILDKRPSHMAARLALVDVLMRLRERDEVEIQVKDLLERFPTDAQVNYVAAAAAFQMTEFERAAELAGRSITLKNTPSKAYEIRAFSRFMLEDYQGFKEDLLSLIEREPSNGDAYYHLGRFYYEKQEFTEALDSLRKATEVTPEHYKAFYFLGWCLQAQGDLAAAMVSYKASIAIIDRRKTRYGWPFTDLGELLIMEGDYNEGLGWMYRGIRNDPGLPYARYKYASALMKDGETAEVEQELLKAVELDPGYTEAYYSLGRYYQAIGEPEKSKEAFARFQELRKNPMASPYGIRRGR